MHLRPILLTAALVAVVYSLVLTSSAAEPIFASATEHHTPSVHITVRRGDISPWPPAADTVDVYCFFQAANVAHVDGQWWAVNGIARTGYAEHGIDLGGRSFALDTLDDAGEALRKFLDGLNDRMNEACP